jgi:hypothetical protein
MGDRFGGMYICMDIGKKRQYLKKKIYSAGTLSPLNISSVVELSVIEKHIYSARKLSSLNMSSIVELSVMD